jgi:predicted translation initiation factor SUI1
MFAAVDPAHASTAAAAFSAAAGRVGLPWLVRSGSYTDFRGDVSVIVCVDQASLCIQDWEGGIERFRTADIETEVNKLLARLLGGSDHAPQPSPLPSKEARKASTVKLSRETAGRRGKGVTVVSDLPLTGDQLKELATRLKNACGTGGTVKDGRIEIQGDQRDRLAQELEKLGYKVKRAGG